MIMIKAKNKFNIGDLVYVSKLSDNSKKRYKVEGMYIEVYKNGEVRVMYIISNENGSYASEAVGLYFLENDLFWTYDECIKRKDCGELNRVKNHFRNIIVRLFLVLIIAIAILPYFAIQLVHWLFTGRNESNTELIMRKLTNKLERL